MTKCGLSEKGIKDESKGFCLNIWKVEISVNVNGNETLGEADLGG